MSRRVGIAVGLVTALGLGGGWMAFDAARASSHKSPFKLEKARVERGDVTGRVTATGTLSALVTVQVGSQVSGRIAELNADFGQRVKKGQVIAKLDERMFAGAGRAGARQPDSGGRRSREGARAGRGGRAQAAAHAGAGGAEAGRQGRAGHGGHRGQGRAGGGGGGRREPVAGDGRRINQAQVNLGYTTIVSPINGIVISRNVDVGQTVAASLQAPTLFTIAEDLGKMQVHAAVSEADVGRLEPGMTATFVVDAYPDREVQGRHPPDPRRAADAAERRHLRRRRRRRQRATLRLKPGMTANVTFVYAERKGVLRIPSAALRFRPPEELLASAAAGRRSAAEKKKKHKVEKEAARGDDGVGATRRRAASARRATTKSVWVLDGDKLKRGPGGDRRLGRQQGRGARRRARRRRRAGHRRRRQGRRRPARTRACSERARAVRRSDMGAARRSSRSPTSPRPTAWARSRWRRCAA